MNISSFYSGACHANPLIKSQQKHHLVQQGKVAAWRNKTAWLKCIKYYMTRWMLQGTIINLIGRICGGYSLYTELQIKRQHQ